MADSWRTPSFNGAALRGGRIGPRPAAHGPPRRRFNGAALRGGRIDRRAGRKGRRPIGLQRSRPPRRADSWRRARLEQPMNGFNGAALRGGRIAGLPSFLFTFLTCFNGAALRGGRIGVRLRIRNNVGNSFNGAALRGGRIARMRSQSLITSRDASTEPPSEEGG